jgi:TRAP-type mannitol/chloroaromatic compound transport system substrate-binding protein
MKKNIFFICIILLVVLSVIIGCAGTAPAPATTSTTTSEPAAPTTPTFDLKIQTFQPGDQGIRTTDTMIPLIEKLTKGTIKITAYSAGELFPPDQVIDAVKTGALDMTLTNCGYTMGLIPAAEFGGGMPGAFRNIEESQFFMWERGLVDLLKAEHEKFNMYFIPFEAFGRSISTKKPINKISDLQGMKIRGYAAGSIWLELAGASAVFVAAPEIYTAASTGGVDGGDWGAPGIQAELKLYEVCPYYMEPMITAGGGFNDYLVNLDLWKKFTPEQQQEFELAVRLSGYTTQTQTSVANIRGLDKFKIVELSADEQAKQAALARQVWDKWAEKDPLNAKVIQMLKDFRAETDLVPTLPRPYPW